MDKDGRHTTAARGRGVRLAARVASVRAALSAVITDDVDQADRLDVLEGAYRVLGDAMDPMWTAWERFDQGEMQERPPSEPGSG